MQVNSVYPHNYWLIEIWSIEWPLQKELNW